MWKLGLDKRFDIHKQIWGPFNVAPKHVKIVSSSFTQKNGEDNEQLRVVGIS